MPATPRLNRWGWGQEEVESAKAVIPKLSELSDRLLALHDDVMWADDSGVMWDELRQMAGILASFSGVLLMKLREADPKTTRAFQQPAGLLEE